MAPIEYQRKKGLNGREIIWYIEYGRNYRTDYITKFLEIPCGEEGASPQRFRLSARGMNQYHKHKCGFRKREADKEWRVEASDFDEEENEDYIWLNTDRVPDTGKVIDNPSPDSSPRSSRINIADSEPWVGKAITNSPRSDCADTEEDTLDAAHSDLFATEKSSSDSPRSDCADTEDPTLEATHEDLFATEEPTLDATHEDLFVTEESIMSAPQPRGLNTEETDLETPPASLPPQTDQISLDLNQSHVTDTRHSIEDSPPVKTKTKLAKGEMKSYQSIPKVKKGKTIWVPSNVPQDQLSSIDEGAGSSSVGNSGQPNLGNPGTATTEYTQASISEGVETSTPRLVAGSIVNPAECSLEEVAAMRVTFLENAYSDPLITEKIQIPVAESVVEVSASEEASMEPTVIEDANAISPAESLEKKPPAIVQTVTEVTALEESDEESVDALETVDVRNAAEETNLTIFTIEDREPTPPITRNTEIITPTFEGLGKISPSSEDVVMNTIAEASDTPDCVAEGVGTKPPTVDYIPPIVIGDMETAINEALEHVTITENPTSVTESTQPAGSKEDGDLAMSSWVAQLPGAIHTWPDHKEPALLSTLPKFRQEIVVERVRKQFGACVPISQLETHLPIPHVCSELFLDANSVFSRLPLHIDRPLDSITNENVQRQRALVRKIFNRRPIDHLSMNARVIQLVPWQKPDDLAKAILQLPGVRSEQLVLWYEENLHQADRVYALKPEFLGKVFGDLHFPPETRYLGSFALLDHSSLISWIKFLGHSVRVLNIRVLGADLWRRVFPVASNYHLQLLPLIALVATVLAKADLRGMRTVRITGCTVFAAPMNRMWASIPNKTPLLGVDPLLNLLCNYPFTDRKSRVNEEVVPGPGGQFKTIPRKGNFFDLRTPMQWQRMILDARHNAFFPKWEFKPLRWGRWADSFDDEPFAEVWP